MDALKKNNFHEVAIRVEHVSKIYKLYNKPVDRFKEAVIPFSKNYHKEFYAIKDISFDIRRGETVGLIGKNGSGKSTLLKMVTKVLTPTSGNIIVNGHISALLELGAGFNPDFTGLENIYFHGMVMGFNKAAMDRKLEEILTFADIGDFIDQPVKLYSSGMFVWLAFAVATSVEPDIMIVDEALAVGDVAFQNKCFRKFESLKKAGKTILLVTHSLDMVTRHCDRAILVNEGLLLADGKPNEVVNIFTEMMTGKKNSQGKKKELNELELLDCENNKVNSFFVGNQDLFKTRKNYNPTEFRWGDGRVTILDYALFCNEEMDPSVITANSEINLYVKFKFNECVDNFMCGIIFKTLDGMVVFTYNTRMENQKITKPEDDILIVSYKFVARLLSGKYTISIGCSENLEDLGEDTSALDRRNDAIIVEVVNKLDSNGVMDPNMVFEVVKD